MTRIRLRPDVAVRVDYRDVTAYGSPVSTRPDDETRRLFAPAIDRLAREGFGAVSGDALPDLAGVVAGREFAEVARRDGAGGWTLRPEVLYPDTTRAVAHTLTIGREDTDQAVQATIPAGLWPGVHDLIADLSYRGHDESTAVGAEVRALLEGMRDQDLVEVDPAVGSPSTRPGLTFVGHNTVVVRSNTTSVVIDPFLLPESAAFPSGYQPLGRHQLGPIDAVVLTHSHPDHFDVASLLRFDRDTLMVVPVVERETILSIAMAERLAELGFHRITALAWGTSMSVGDIDIHALPFYGEQPAEHEVLHPEVRNAGNTYVLRTPSFAAAFVADSGRDPAGDVKALARDWTARNGPVDLVFSGYRGWQIYPAQLLFSSVSRYLLFVPSALWATRQRLMNGVDDALDVAELWGARYLVPYADGGAPWYWSVGLGPRLDGQGEENATFDPFPERVVHAAERRSQASTGTPIPSAVGVLLLRPGDSLSLTGTHPDIQRTPGHAWPYDQAR